MTEAYGQELQWAMTEKHFYQLGTPAKATWAQSASGPETQSNAPLGTRNPLSY